MDEVIRLRSSLADPSDFLRDAMLSQRFADVALCCQDGQRFLAHRLVLSAASPFLQEVLLAHSCTSHDCNPISHHHDCEPLTTLILTEVNADELGALLGLVYTGNATITRSRFNDFIRVAESLGIKLPDFYELSSFIENLSRDDEVTEKFAERRRRVANRVIASPWRQIVRPPDISPRLRPIVLRGTRWSCGDGEIDGKDTDARNDGLGNATPIVVSRSHHQITTTLPTASPNNDIQSSPPIASSTVNAITNNANEYLDHGESRSEPSLPMSRLRDDATKDDFYAADDINNNDKNVNDDNNVESNARETRDEGFVTEASLKVHQRARSSTTTTTTTTTKPFACQDCGKEFSQLRNYKYHRSIHEGTREFAANCQECGKTFNDRGYLSSHMKIHRNRKEYSCAVCGKSFNQRVAYNMHARIHTGLKPHACEQCGKTFSRKMLLKQHKRIHSGERPYRCHVCNKAFADRSNMTLHARLHTGLKPYRCNVCDKAFTKKHHLKTHANYHTGTKPYACPNCDLCFSQSSNMRTHYKKCLLKGETTTRCVVEDRGFYDRPMVILTPPNSDDQESVVGGNS